MVSSFFLYRRLSQWITCEFKLKNNAKISLKNKYEVASFKDVFCHPFYWQIFHWINSPPKLVVDCGAHCGHFSILADICLNSKFGYSDTRYILIEPNPYLLPSIHKNIAEADMSSRVEIEQGLLGTRKGEDTLWINPKNYLTTGLSPSPNSKPFKVQYIDLLKLVGNQIIDIMKIDIEGGEFDFINSNLDLFSQVNLIFMELHEATLEKHQELFKGLQLMGLDMATKPVEANGQQLIIFQRQEAIAN